jgi:hypothetical protein
MPDYNQERVREALSILEEEGRKCYKPEYQKEIPAFQAIGLAIARVDESSRHCVQLSYSWLEDWNYHNLCAVLEWAHPIYGQTFDRSDLKRLARLMDRKSVTIRGEWDSEKTEYKTSLVNVRMVFEDVKEE